MRGHKNMLECSPLGFADLLTHFVLDLQLSLTRSFVAVVVQVELKNGGGAKLFKVRLLGKSQL